MITNFHINIVFFFYYTRKWEFFQKKLCFFGEAANLSKTRILTRFSIISSIYLITVQMMKTISLNFAQNVSFQSLNQFRWQGKLSITSLISNAYATTYTQSFISATWNIISNCLWHKYRRQLCSELASNIRYFSTPLNSVGNEKISPQIRCLYVQEILRLPINYELVYLRSIHFEFN